ncbi:MAG TPA: metal ABC transporter ATP-binding protein [Anaerolineae bacterium]|nr:metal ABC transporter ATP-binding protein [Anaerolineae bacterium]
MAEPLVELQGVTFGYGRVPVVENIDLHLHPGQFAGLLGPSGSGKTTILKLILGMLSPQRGTVFVDGNDLQGRPSRRVAYVPQLETIDWNFPVTVEQVVLMGRIKQMGLLPWASRADKHAAAEMMERLGIGEMRKRHIRDLSGGQQQRTFLARALLANPDLLVLDEPTAGVDMGTQENVLRLLAELNRGGVTILMTTHDLNAAAAHIPWVICMNRSVVASGPPDQVFTPKILAATYKGNMVVFRHNDMLFVGQQPHDHTYRDLMPNPVPGDEIVKPDGTLPALSPETEKLIHSDVKEQQWISS